MNTQGRQQIIGIRVDGKPQYKYEYRGLTCWAGSVDEVFSIMGWQNIKEIKRAELHFWDYAQVPDKDLIRGTI